MKNFLLVYNTPIELQGKMAQATPQEIEESMKPWYDWNDRVGSKMVDLGAPTAGAQILQGADNWSTKSTFASGYSIVQAEDLEDLKALLANHPHTAWSNETSIEVHECVAM